MTTTDKHVTRNTPLRLRLLRRPGQRRGPPTRIILSYQPMIRDPCDRLRQQSCQRGLTFVANAARAARHQSCDSQKADVQREPTTQDCYWHEYSLKLCDNDGRVLSAFLHLRIKSSRCAGESDDLERKRVAIWSAKSEPSPSPGQARLRPVPDISAPSSETTPNLFLSTPAPAPGRRFTLLNAWTNQQKLGKGGPPFIRAAQPKRQLGVWKAEPPAILDRFMQAESSR